MATMETGLANGVSFALTDEQKELRARAREFAAKEIRPKAAEHDEHQTHPAGIVAKAHELGLMNLHLPESLGPSSRRSTGCSSARNSTGAARASGRRSRERPRQGRS
jgi:alkylation response protein AidB-like acyl-CoA dehydrogenase